MKRFYPHLFSPQYIRNVRVKNRITVGPTHSPMLAQNMLANSDVFIDYYRQKARGGAGIVTLGEVPVNQFEALGHVYSIEAHTLESERALADIREAIEQYGAIASAELFHAGAYADTEATKGAQPLGPVTYTRPDGVKVQGMSEYQMNVVADQFAETADTLRRCGYKCALVHGSHGWLLSEFLSPYYNTRDDKWGGAGIENRIRFPKMVCERIREAVGNDFIIDYRVNGVDSLAEFPDNKEMFEQGMKIEDSIAFLHAVDDFIDSVHICNHHREDVHSRPQGLPYGYYPDGYFAHLAQKIKASGVKVQVGALGSMDNAELAEKMISEGSIDRIILGRSFIADPEIANKMRLGKTEDIRPCIKCGKCLDRNTVRDNRNVGGKSSKAILGFNRKMVATFKCSVNPELHRGHYPYLPKTENPKKVIIIGGGPGGMQAAITAAQRGHKPIIIEKGDALGGQMKVYENLWFKRRIKAYKAYLITQIEKLNIEVRLNTEATQAMVEAEAPDAVLVAIGADSIVPDIPGVDGKNVFTAASVNDMSRCDELGNKVVVIGASAVGCETVIHLAKVYPDKEFVLVEMGDMIGPDILFTERITVMELLDYNEKIEYFSHTVCKEIFEKGIKVKNIETNEESTIAADSVVLAVGLEAKREEAEAYLDTALDFAVIGDCSKARDIEGAVEDGFFAACSLG